MSRTSNRPPPAPATALRSQAEERLRHERPEAAITGMPVDQIQATLHELHVHQIELEMQNEQLRSSQSELEQARERFEELYDFAPVGYLTLDDQGNIRAANLTAVNMLEVERTRLETMPFSKFVYREDADPFYLCLRKTLNSALSQSCEVRLLGQNKGLIVARLDLIQAFENGGTVCRLTITDITQHKRAEEALREHQKRQVQYENEERLRVAFEAGDLGSWDHDLRTGKVICSDRTRAMLGLEPGATVNWSMILDRLHSDDAPRFLKAMDESANPAEGGRADVEFRIQIKSPKSEVRSPKLGAPNSISARAEATSKVQEPSNGARVSAPAASPDGKPAPEGSGAGLKTRRTAGGARLSSAAASSEGRQASVGPGTGLNSGRAAGEDTRAPGPDKTESGDKAVPAPGEDTRTPAEVRWLRFAARCFFENGSTGRAIRRTGVLADITNQKRAEQVLHSRARELETVVEDRTARLREAVGELEHFSYTLAHDLRAPVRAIRGYGDLLIAQSVNLAPRHKEFLIRACKAAERMDQLILDTLDYTKIVRQHFELKPIETGALVEQVVQSYPQFQEARENITIVAPLPAVMGNAALLTQCFSNLLNNALKFVAPGKEPEVRIYAEESRTASSAFTPAPAANDGPTGRPDAHPASEDRRNARPARVRVWVEDNGIGIPEDCRDKVFEMFQQLMPVQYPGTGIGLAIVKKAVERMRGAVGVESHPKGGSRFWIDLEKAAE
ncbi:MAG: hypothetical protein C5B50_20710 [Verrucomicrobia bacterium]|nr:MAG: hypothetical protein C5B50_20710 [Verrucomicrobiota bacterium]